MGTIAFIGFSQFFEYISFFWFNTPLGSRILFYWFSWKICCFLLSRKSILMIVSLENQFSSLCSHPYRSFPIFRYILFSVGWVPHPTEILMQSHWFFWKICACFTNQEIHFHVFVSLENRFSCLCTHPWKSALLSLYPQKF